MLSTFLLSRRTVIAVGLDSNSGPRAAVMVCGHRGIWREQAHYDCPHGVGWWRTVNPSLFLYKQSQISRYINSQRALRGSAAIKHLQEGLINEEENYIISRHVSDVGNGEYNICKRYLLSSLINSTFTNESFRTLLDMYEWPFIQVVSTFHCSLLKGSLDINNPQNHLSHHLLNGEVNKIYLFAEQTWKS